MNKLNFDNFKQHRNRHKCKCCGGEIVYDNTTIGVRGKIRGRSYLTEKVVNGVSYRLQVCQKCLLKYYPNIKNLDRTFNIMSEPTKFAFDIPDDIFRMVKNNYSHTREKMIEKYGEEEGNKKYDEFIKKQSTANTFEYKRDKYGWDYERYQQMIKSRAINLENFIKKYGEEEGKSKWEEYILKQKKSKNKEWILYEYYTQMLEQLKENNPNKDYSDIENTLNKLKPNI